MGKEVDHVRKRGSEVKPEIGITVITGALHQEQLVGLVVGEVEQRIMVHQVEVVATLGEVVVSVGNKPEVEEARTVMAKIVPVWLVEIRMMMALCKLWNCSADSKTFFLSFTVIFSKWISVLLVVVVVIAEVLYTFKSLVPFSTREMIRILFLWLRIKNGTV